jgi:2-methylcitrate dehydratase PrpD
MSVQHAVLQDQTGPTKALCRWAANLRFDDIDTVALARTRAHTLDSIGVCVAGSQEDVAQIAAATLSDVGVSGTVPVAGTGLRTDMLSAAFLMGTGCHGLELDDGFRPGAVHPGCVVIPTALAVAATVNPSGQRFLTSIVAGYEVAARIAALIHPKPRWRGFHNTSTVGVFAAATVTAVLKGFDADILENAFGLAASSSSGIRSYAHGGDVKRIHPGLAARDGILAALLAEKGHQGAPDVLEIPDGFFHAFAGENAAAADADIFAAGGQTNSRFAIADCYVKPHACCRHLHPGIDAVLDILTDNDLAPDDVASIDVATYRVAATHGIIGWSEMTTAQMSYRFTLAAAIQHRSVILQHFSEAGRRDGAVLRHCDKIRVAADDALDATYPERRPARVELRTVDGRSFSVQVDEPLGSATNQLTDDRLQEKFLGLATPVLGQDAAQDVLARVWALDTAGSVHPIIDRLKVGD